MGTLFALLGIGRFVTDESAVFGWVYLGLGAAWFVLGWRLKCRHGSHGEFDSEGHTPSPD